MKHKERVWVVIFLSLFFLDRYLKSLAEDGYAIVFISEVFKFELFRNPGIAFSLPFSGPLVWVISVGILAGVSLMAAKEFRLKRYGMAGAFGLFIFGACSNLFDRVVYGYTVDYLIFFDRSAVNLADGMIVAGALWLILRTK